MASTDRISFIHFSVYSPISREAHNDNNGHDNFTVGGLLFSLR